MPKITRSQDPFERLASVLQGQGSRLATAARMQVRRGVQVTRSDTQTFTDAASIASFNSVVFDTDGFWTPSDPERLTVPAGLGGAYIVTSVIGISTAMSVGIQRNSESINVNIVGVGNGGATSVVVFEPGDFIATWGQMPPSTFAGVFPVLSLIKL